MGKEIVTMFKCIVIHSIIKQVSIPKLRLVKEIKTCSGFTNECDGNKGTLWMFRMLKYKMNGLMVPSLTVKFSTHIIITNTIPDTTMGIIRKR